MLCLDWKIKHNFLICIIIAPRTTTTTIDYEHHFNDEFEQLLSKHPNITFSDLPEIEKIDLAEKHDFLKEVVGGLFGKSFKMIEGAFLSDSSAFTLSTITDMSTEHLEKVFNHWYYSILGFNYDIAAEPMNIYIIKLNGLHLLFFEYKRYPNFEDLLEPPSSNLKVFIPGIPDAELEEAINYSISLTRSWLKNIKPTMDELTICHRDNHHHNMVYDTDNKRWIMIDWDTAKEKEEVPGESICDDWPHYKVNPNSANFFQFIAERLDHMSEQELIHAIKGHLRALQPMLSSVHSE